MWKDFFYFSRTEKRGIILLSVIILIIVATGCILPLFHNEKSAETPDEFEKKYAEFISSIKKTEQEKRYVYKSDRYDGEKNHSKNVVLSVFDPNTADSVTLLRLGLPSWMAKNILTYRARGGKFRIPEDFRKVYGLSDEQYTMLRPYIRIDESRQIKDTVYLSEKQHTGDTLKQYKYPAGTIVDLNQADTAELKKIPGIGSALARKITGYRSRLGGFYSIAQLHEIDLDTAKLAEWFNVEQTGITRMNLNKVSIERLNSHPYFNFYQAKAIIEHRKKKGKIKSLKQFALYEEFTPGDFRRIAHYVCFE